MEQMLLPFVFAHFERDQSWTKEGVGIGALGVGEEELIIFGAEKRRAGPSGVALTLGW